MSKIFTNKILIYDVNCLVAVVNVPSERCVSVLSTSREGDVPFKANSRRGYSQPANASEWIT